MAATMRLNMDKLKREYTDNRNDVQKLRFFCRGDRYQLLGPVRGQPPSGLSGRERPALPARHRPARARHALAHHLWRADLAHHRPVRRRGELHPRHRHRRHRRLSRRHHRSRRAAHHRGPAIAAEHSLVAGARRDHAGRPGVPLLVYFGITIILGLLDWTGLARAVRSKLLALREEDYVLAAQLMGASTTPHHRPPSGSGLHVASHRLGDHLHPRHDPRRNGAELPRPRS